LKSRPKTVIAFDFGLRQIGVAVGNCLLATAQPLAVLRAKDGVPDWQAVSQLIAEWRPDLLVVGDPINMDGSDSELSARARKFARRLHGRFSLPVAMADERLSSFEAKQLNRERGHRGDYRRHPIDSDAAELVLRSWLDNPGEKFIAE
jgi:putative Holliday junction resolvase